MIIRKITRLAPKISRQYAPSIALPIAERLRRTMLYRVPKATVTVRVGTDAHADRPWRAFWRGLMCACFCDFCLRQTSRLLRFLPAANLSASAIFACGKPPGFCDFCLRQTSRLLRFLPAANLPASVIFACGRPPGFCDFCLRQTSRLLRFLPAANLLASAIFACGRNTVAPRQSKPCGLQQALPRRHL